MSARARWGIVLGVLVVVAAGVAAWLALRPEPRLPPADFAVSDPQVDSSDMALAVDEVRGVVRGGRTDWRCLLRCREAGGCHARLLVTVQYLSSGRERSVTFADAIAVARGEVGVLGGSQRPAEAVDSVRRVRVRVEQRLQAGTPDAVTYE